ncbi:PIN domain-containing protein [Gracilimonas mengyeensis]|uniref:Predicted nucleic acid-binding protein, contains PIN domain n=1 Tax=Gracilimonas mengyeensis TaxID=1302730 RepID=A0A521F9A5_9BACT|nr:PIN domain-containing protein [Gracilimonas mengyeensis]SMO92799.1 Predicted nucleic acid-binding protein, contains PIN domain [Gracilimonas mengyeensis]
MSDKVFLDTNIFAYAFDRTDVAKQEKASELIKTHLENGSGIISYQIVQEFINVSYRKFKNPMTLRELEQYIENVLSHMWEVYASKDLIYSAIGIKEQFKYSFYDSLIIAAALEAGCTTLYSEDLQHEQKVYSVQIVDPFVVG